MKISVAIPTRERAEFLRASLATCVAIDDPDLEIVVCDNASADNTVDVVQSFADPRIRLIRQPERVSQRLNFERAARESTGDYILMMGDDDGMLTSSYPLMRHVLVKERPSVLSVPSIFYRWPTPDDPTSGRLKLKKKGLFGQLHRISASTQRAAIEQCAMEGPDRTPKLYHGFASRPLLQRMIDATGCIFASGQVDLYFAAAALRFIDDYMHLEHPATILAMGPQSGGLSVQKQYSEAAASNITATRVAAEQAKDPLAEPINGRMPVLGMYLLTGLEQARRHAWAGDLRLDHAAYLSRIIKQLSTVPPEARQLACDQLAGLFRDISRTDLVERVEQERLKPAAAAHAAPVKSQPFLEN
jgi:hypothetical protein